MLSDLVRFDYRRSLRKGEEYVNDESYIAKRISLELGQVLARIVIQTESCRRRRANIVNCAQRSTRAICLTNTVGCILSADYTRMLFQLSSLTLIRNNLTCLCTNGRNSQRCGRQCRWHHYAMSDLASNKKSDKTNIFPTIQNICSMRDSNMSL